MHRVLLVNIKLIVFIFPTFRIHLCSTKNVFLDLDCQLLERKCSTVEAQSQLQVANSRELHKYLIKSEAVARERVE